MDAIASAEMTSIPTSDTEIVLSLRDVRKVFQIAGQPAVRAVDGVSLDIKRGEFTIITGRSGCGKTTLLNLASGLLSPTSGQVRVLGHDIWRMSDRDQSALRNRKIGFIFQFPSVMPGLTVLENVLLPTAFGASTGGEDGRERARQLLESVGLADKLDSLPRQLSKGQQQRVVVARSLVNRPEVLIADEPTSDLDEQTEQEIMALLRQVHVDTGVTILLVTHASELTRFGTRSIRMSEGKVVSA